MKIRILGFRLELNPELTLAELVAQMAHRSGKPVPHAGYSRILTITETDKYILGSFWTMKGVSKFTEIDMTSLKMAVKELDKGKSLAVFNFFVISTKNLNGLYSYYHHSTSIPIFGSFLDSLGGVVTGPKMNAELKAVGETGLLRKHRKNAIREKYEYAVRCHYLVSRKKLAELIEKWERFKSFEYTVTHLEPGAQGYAGLKPFVRAKTTKLAFERASVGAHVKDEILKFVKDLDYTKARIEGVDDSGADRTIDLLETPDWFGEEDYEKFLGDPTLFAENLNGSCMIKHILKEIEDHPEYFDIGVQ